MNKSWTIAALLILAAAFLLPNLINGFGTNQASMHSANVTEITDATFEAEVMNHDGPVIVEAYATWCGPCKSFKPKYNRAADNNHQKAKFVTFDVDKNPGIAGKLGVTGIPLTVCVKGTGKNRMVNGVLRGDGSYSRIENLVEACAKP